MTNVDVLVKFLVECAGRDDVPGRLRKLVVSHVIKGNKYGEEIRAVSVPDSVDDDWRETTARKIAEQCLTEAIALASGRQRYVVQALFAGDDKPHGRVILTVEADDADSNALDTEGPDGVGLVTAAMAQTRFFAQLGSRTLAQQNASLYDEVGKLRAENEQLRKERVKSLEVFEGLLQQRHERELELRREDAKTRGIEQAFDKLALLAPVAINHWAGRKILPENAPERMIMQTLAQRLTPEKLQRLASSGALDESELVAFVSMLRSYAGDFKPEEKPADASPANGVSS